MGELLDALNELDERAAAPDKPVVSFVDLAAQIFRTASRTVNEAIDRLSKNAVKYRSLIDMAALARDEASSSTRPHRLPGRHRDPAMAGNPGPHGLELLASRLTPHRITNPSRQGQRPPATQADRAKGP